MCLCFILLSSYTFTGNTSHPSDCPHPRLTTASITYHPLFCTSPSTLVRPGPDPPPPPPLPPQQKHHIHIPSCSIQHLHLPILLPPRIIFPGGGINYWWQQGVTDSLLSNLPSELLPALTYSGASAGAFSAIMALYGVQAESALTVVNEVADQWDLWNRGPWGLYAIWAHMIRQWMERLLIIQENRIESKKMHVEKENRNQNENHSTILNTDAFQKTIRFIPTKIQPQAHHTLLIPPLAQSRISISIVVPTWRNYFQDFIDLWTHANSMDPSELLLLSDDHLHPTIPQTSLPPPPPYQVVSKFTIGPWLMTEKSFHSFLDLDDLISCSIASAHIPFFLNGHLFTDYKGFRAIDGYIGTRKVQVDRLAPGYQRYGDDRVIVIDHHNDDNLNKKVSWIGAVKVPGDGIFALHRMIDAGRKWGNQQFQKGAWDSLIKHAEIWTKHMHDHGMVPTDLTLDPQQ